MLLSAIQNLNAGILSGTVIDNTTDVSMQYVTIAIYQNGIIIKGGESNSDGFFSIENLPSAKLEVKLSYIGFETLTQEIDFTLKKKIENIFLMNQQNTTIDMIEIVAFKYYKKSCCCCRGYVSSTECYTADTFQDFDLKRPDSESNRAFNINVYPNPTTDFIIINNNGASDKALIINTKGSVIKSIKLSETTSHKIDMFNFLPGTYIIQFFKTGKLINSEKIIVVR